MSAWKNRPYAKAAQDIPKEIGRTSVTEGSAQVSALFAVAYAILDLSDGAREIATEIRNSQENNQ